VGVEKEYWQSLTYLPQHSTGWTGQDKGQDIRWQHTTMPKLGESRYA